MPNYVLNRNYTYRSTSGVVEFKKGEPAWVPPFMEKEIVAIGGECVDGAAPSALDPEKPALVHLSPDERTAQVYIAFDMLTERNDAKDFTAAGVPSVKAVEKIVDFDVDRVELARMWQEYREAKAGEQ